MGRNGTGKSTLLRHVARRELPGMATTFRHMRIVHVAQELAGDATPVVECVLRADATPVDSIIFPEKIAPEHFTGIGSRVYLEE